MTLPHELVSVVCFFCDKPSLAAVCLGNKAFCSEARPILYGRMVFRSSKTVARFVGCAEHRLDLVKDLNLFIPEFSSHRTKVWTHLLSAVRKAECLVRLRMSCNPIDTSSGQDFQTLVGDILGLVPAATAVQCPALKEVEGNFSWTKGLARLDQEKAHVKPKLNTLCHGQDEITLPLLKSLFDLRVLTRLSINQLGGSSLDGMSELMEETCLTLQELALWMLSEVDRGWITKITKLQCPNLQILAVLNTDHGGNEVYWEMCGLLVPALLCISPQLRELRLYIHNCGPSEILSTPFECIPDLSPQILVMRVFCWTDRNIPRKVVVAEAEERMRRCFGRGREFGIEWNRPLATLLVRGTGKTFSNLGPSVFEELKSFSFTVTQVDSLRSLKVGEKIAGAAIIIDDAQTIVVGPDWWAVVTRRHLVIERGDLDASFCCDSWKINAIL
ncbi:hypothetical protein DL96DRAFT_1557385 [Flagelloscypha sp. PMI_526]|nr:hypothetical protein DL96DRAFT_1557385 [Flagelloscypha sp. PMI_526]